MNTKDKINALKVIESVMDCDDAEQAAMTVVRSGIDVAEGGHKLLFLIDDSQESQWMELAMLIASIQRKARRDVQCRDRSMDKTMAENLGFLLGVRKKEWFDRPADSERRFCVVPPRGMHKTWELIGNKAAFRQAVIADAVEVLNHIPEGLLPQSDVWK